MSYFIAPALKSDKKAILRFYRQQRYSARFLGFDTCYLVKRSSDNYDQDTIIQHNIEHNTNQHNIVGAVIVSQLNRSHSQSFLHALVIDSSVRQQGLALKLLTHCRLHHSHLVAFCSPELVALYSKAGFHQTKSETLTTVLAARYQGYLAKQPRLIIMSTE